MKAAVLIIAAAICLALSGCGANFLPTREEIDEYEIVQAVGVDKCEQDPSQVEVTFVRRSKKGGGSMDGGGDLISILSGTGKTFFEAQRKIKATASKTLFFGYVDYFLFGEEAAKEDLHKYFDLIERNHEIRLSPRIYIVRGGTAKELLFKSSSKDRYIGEKLQSIKKGREYLSDTFEVRVIDVAGMLDSPPSLFPLSGAKIS
jgi:spore germination protein KC